MDFQTEKKALFERLGERGYMVLATSADDKPLASTMTCVMDGEAIYMQTDSSFPKVAQIKENPRVALCSGSVQIEGIATLLGHPLAPESAKFAELFQLYYPESFERYSKVAREIVIKVIPLYVLDWLYEAGSLDMVRLDFEKEQVEVVTYDATIANPTNYADLK